MNLFFASNKCLAISAVAAVFLLFDVSVSAQTSETRTATLWQYISYPELSFSKTSRDPFTMLVGYGQAEQKGTFRVDINWWSANSDPTGIKKASRFKLHLHYPDGTVVEPTEQPDGPPGGAGDAINTDWDQMYFFPCGPNKLLEAWVELCLPDRTYWLEVPYGFTRNPRAPLSPAEPDAGLPTLAPAMKHLALDDRIVPWTRVDYDLGPIQNGWRISLKLANPSDAQAEAVLYRDDVQVGKSMFLWQLDTPKTSMEIRLPGGNVLATRTTGKRLHEDGMRRSDGYAFNRYPADGRDWGKLVIKVDDHVSECVLPSSLYKYMHGRAGYPDAKLVLVPEQTPNP